MIRRISEGRTLAVLLVVALAILYGGWLVYVIRADRPLDFYVYYLAMEEFVRGGDAYTVSDPAWDALAAELGITNYTRPYRYPPATAALLAPLRYLGPQGASAVWLVLSAAAMIWGAWLLGSIFEPAYGRAVSLATLLILVPPLATLLAGQINAFLYLCLAAGLVFLLSGKEWPAAVSLAAGAVLKVIPLALIAYLFWRRQWRVGLYAVLAVVILMLVTVPLVGVDGLGNYVQNALLLSRPDSVYANPTNQTIGGALARLFQDATQESLLGMARVLALAIIGATALACWPRGEFKRFVVVEYALIVCALQVIPPFTWYHQLVLLQIPLSIAVMRSFSDRRWWLLGIWITLLILNNVHGLFWHQIEAQFGLGWWLSFPFLLSLSLWCYFLWELAAQKLARDSSNPQHV